MQLVRVGSVALLAIVGSLALGGGTATATPATVAYVVMYSDTGDWVGGGVQREFDPGNASITVYGGASALTISLDGGTSGDYFDMDFAAQPGAILTSGGIYTQAQRAPFREAGHPGIDIYGNGAGCNTDSGMFEVKDIATDPTGAISRLWIIYEQHCEGARPALWGEVKLNEPVDFGATIAVPGIVRWPTTDVGAPNTVVPVTVVALGSTTINGVSLTGTNAADFTIRANECSSLAMTGGDACQVWLRLLAKAPGARQATLHITDTTGGSYDVTLQGFAYGGKTAVTMTSDAGDYIGQGQTWSYSLANGDQIGMGGGRSFAGFGVNGANGDWWSADFVPAAGDILVSGETYSNATRYPFNGSGPGLDVSGMGRGCNELTGSFTVNSATFAADGTLRTASISFVQHCEGATPALHGTFAFRAGDSTPPAPWMIPTAPVVAPPPATSPPTISGFTPNAGQPGTVVTITGANFTGATGVTFGGTSAAFSLDSSTQITAAVPSNAATGRISVTTGAGTAVSGGTFTVSSPPVEPAPTIASFSPASGPPGTAVTITGTHLTGATAVTLHGVAAVYNVISSTQIQTVVPAGSSTGTFSVTTSGGTATSSSQFLVTGGSLSPPPGEPLVLKRVGSGRVRHKATVTVTARFQANQAAQLSLSVSLLARGQKVALLRGSRLVGTTLAKRRLAVTATLDRAGRYALRLILPRRGLTQGRTYVISLTGRPVVGTLTTLNIRFRA
ncbi:MAG: IPT/TIG domain-containing protein [Gaiellaceae bacterium]